MESKISNTSSTEFIDLNNAEQDQDEWRVILNAVVNQLNQSYAVVLYGSKTLVLKNTFDDSYKRNRRAYMTERDFYGLLKNILIQVGENEKGKPIFKSKGVAWFEHRKRKQFIDGIVFYPSTYLNGIEVKMPLHGNKLNLWEGFSVEPAQSGTWDKLQFHIEKVICRGNKECYEYLLNWIARCFQRPDLNGQVAIALKGEKGTGKGTLGGFLKSLFGQHGLQVNNPKHLIGNFNAHMSDCCFLFADEVFHAGDKQSENILKGIITEPTLMIERKGIDAEEVPNRLKIMMTSNNDWIVPASKDERRYFVLEVSNTYINNKIYFDPLRAELEQKETKEAFLWDMLHRDISDFNVNKAPETEALQNQRAQSLDSFGKYWKDALDRGYLYQSQSSKQLNQLNDWIPEPAMDLIMAGYKQWCNAHGINQYGIISRVTLGNRLTNWGYTKKRTGQSSTRSFTIGENVKGETLTTNTRCYFYSVGSLEEAQVNFYTVEKLAMPDML